MSDEEHERRKSLEARWPGGTERVSPAFGQIEQAVLRNASGTDPEGEEDGAEYQWLQQQLAEAVAQAGAGGGDDDDGGEEMAKYQDSLIHNAMLECCEAGDSDSLSELLEQSSSSDRPIDLNAPGPDGDTAIHLAALYGSLECVKLLLKAGADADSLNTEDGSSALHDAAAGGYLDIMKLLHEKTPECINTADFDGDTPLHNAARGNHKACVLWLMHNGALPDAKNGEGRTPAEEADDPSIVQLIEAVAAKQAGK